MARSESRTRCFISSGGSMASKAATFEFSTSSGAWCPPVACSTRTKPAIMSR
jgi:hypothetical protein